MKKQHGFTLIEVLLYIVLSGMLLVVLVSLFTLSLNSRQKNQTITEVDQQGAAALEQITAALRSATAFTAPATGVTANSLTITVPTASLSPTVISLSGSTLQIKEGTATAVPITNSRVVVSNLSFQNLSRASTAGVMQVSFTVSHLNSLNRNEFEYQKTFTTSVARE